MLKLTIFSTLYLILQSLCGINAISGWQIADRADFYIGETLWNFASDHRSGPGTNKCNFFVADVIWEAGGAVPHRYFGISGPIGAGEWGNPNSTYLSDDECWHNVNSPQIGDVMGDGVHVAIITGRRKTTSAASHEVVKNDWGFRREQRNTQFTYWRYIC
ncbi:hypothetical protein SNE40_023387 [Patella caerulea]|uniref:Uncharacterized protein n=1 Tax=Patella caerulea TaxID=87958 RepID=A0AAN8G2Y9_PATCE